MKKEPRWTIRHDGKVWKAYQLCFLWEHGMDSIPDGCQIHHLCHNGACLNVDHMVLLTEAEHKGCHWKGNSLSKGLLNKGGKKIAQIHPKYGLLKIWVSARDADRNGGFSYKQISKAVTGYRETYADCWWMKI